MVATTTNGTFSIMATDATGLRSVHVRVPTGRTIGELVTDLAPRMRLPAEANGQQLSYSARLERGGRMLHNAERISDTLQDDDRLMVAPSIDAG